MALDSNSNSISNSNSNLASSELSSESDGSEFLSDSIVDVKYRPLSGDSEADNATDESVALLAHEMLCCDCDTATESDNDGDPDGDPDGDQNVLNAIGKYALLVCSEDDDELDLGLQQQLQQQQHLKQQAQALEDAKKILQRKQ